MASSAVSLEAKAKRLGIKYFLISFTDLFGAMRSKLVPASAIGGMQKEGAGFAGFAVWLDMTPAHPDMFALPDPDSLIQLPWKPEVGWLAADLHMDGQPVAQSPRVTLKRQIAAAAKKGYRMRHGVECEFFLINQDGSAIADSRDQQAKPCYDQDALMRRYDVIAEICDAMQNLGWGPYQNDHEDGNGQFEMNWDYADALVTADRHAFFKHMVRAVAERNGLRATFMPKPFTSRTGNGCHMHVSLWDGKGSRNLFLDRKDELGLSTAARHFLGGVLRHAPALCAVLAPTVNSYKRLNAPPTSSGATWSPNTITWSGNNRTHMVRIPDAGRFELRLGDGATNPYLLPAAVLAAGLEGLADKADPGPCDTRNMYAPSPGGRRPRQLPLNLLDALRAFERDRVLRERLGEETSAALLKLRLGEWNDYVQHLTEWERRSTLDC